MSTKKKLIELVGKIAAIEKEERSAFSQINAYEIAQDKPKLLKELSKLYEELERKRKTPITKELLEKNGFEGLPPRLHIPIRTWRLKDNPNFSFEEFMENQRYLVEGITGVFIDKITKGTFQMMLASTKTNLKTIADLEDALDLCRIDKEIKI